MSDRQAAEPPGDGGADGKAKLFRSARPFPWAEFRRSAELEAEAKPAHLCVHSPRYSRAISSFWELSTPFFAFSGEFPCFEGIPAIFRVFFGFLWAILRGLSLCGECPGSWSRYSYSTADPPNLLSHWGLQHRRIDLQIKMSGDIEAMSIDIEQMSYDIEQMSRDIGGSVIRHRANVMRHRAGCHAS